MNKFTYTPKFLLSLIGMIFIITALQAQETCIILRPDRVHGKDAYIDDLAALDMNAGNHNDFAAIAWTNNGTPVVARGLIEFDLVGLPVNTTINSADLSLYSYNSPQNGPHSPLSGSNEAILSRVTSSWEENTVTWNTQPTYTNQNQVILPATTASIQDYLDIDVTALVQDMVVDPQNSHGFVFHLVTEQYYRRMLFASSDNPDSDLHPQLEVCYTTEMPLSSGRIEDYSAKIKLYPMPASDFVILDISEINNKLVSVEIINTAGQILNTYSATEIHSPLDVSNLIHGHYLVKVNFEEFSSIKKLVIN